MSKINMEEKVATVVRKRNEVMILVRNSLMENCNKMITRINELIEIHSDNQKLVNALNKEKELVHSLGEQIVFAKSAEDIKKIRTKLNYYITKIKKELKDRNYDIDTESSYDELIVAIRDDIKEYIRCFKRKDNLDKIQSKNLKKLTRDEKKEINHELAKERKFNKRLVEKYSKVTSEPEYEVAKEIKEIFYKEEIVEVEPEEEINFEQIEDEKLEKVDIQVEDTNEIDFEKIEVEPEEKQQETVVEKAVVATDVAAAIAIPLSSTERIYINSKMMKASTHYIISNVRKYGANTFANIKNFFVNIPAYMHNKRIIKLMKSDYSNFYSGRDLKELIELSETNNSIKEALLAILRNSKLSRKFNPNTEEYLRLQDERYKLVEIIQEYRIHHFEKKPSYDFSFTPIRSTVKEEKHEVLEGGIDFMPISNKRLSMR